MAAFEAAHGAADKLTVKMMAEAAAERLANTPAISRSSYIHPSILDLAALEPDQRLASDHLAFDQLLSVLFFNVVKAIR